MTIIELIDMIEERVIFMSYCSDKAKLSEYKGLVKNIRKKLINKEKTNVS